MFKSAASNKLRAPASRKPAYVFAALIGLAVVAGTAAVSAQTGFDPKAKATAAMKAAAEDALRQVPPEQRLVQRPQRQVRMIPLFKTPVSTNDR
ncbi:MAG: hypothetical protein AB7F96_02480 [Beijerinckiaceae bacterium]